VISEIVLMLLRHGDTQRPCPDCKRLEAVVALLQKQLDRALARIADLESESARLKKNSTTSSKPPSSDIVKPPRRRRAVGNVGSDGPAVSWDMPAIPGQCFRRSRWTRRGTTSGRMCPQAGRHLIAFTLSSRSSWSRSPTSSPSIAPDCMKTFAPARWLAAPLPPEVRRAGLLGPRLTALVAYQKGACHMSVETIRRFLADVFRLPISHGQVVKTVQKAASAFGPCYGQLQGVLPQQAYMGIDETGHPERGRGLWSWCFHVPGQDRFTWFHIDDSRGSKVLQRYLAKRIGGSSAATTSRPIGSFCARPRCGCNCAGHT